MKIGFFREFSSHNRVYPTEMWPASGGGPRWRMRWHPGVIAIAETKRYPILAVEGLGVTDFGHSSYQKKERDLPPRYLLGFIIQKRST